MILFYKYIPSPMGEPKLVASRSGLVAILWRNDNPRRVPLPTLTEDNTHPILLETERQLTEYFVAERNTFSIPLNMRGTAFRKEVWRALQAIPFGSTMTYGEIARLLGRPAATRAVGAANGRNSISIIVPCHRVIRLQRQAHRIRRWPRRQVLLVEAGKIVPTSLTTRPVVYRHTRHLPEEPQRLGHSGKVLFLHVPRPLNLLA